MATRKKGHKKATTHHKKKTRQKHHKTGGSVKTQVDQAIKILQTVKKHV